MESLLKEWFFTVALYSTAAPLLFLLLAPYFKLRGTSYRNWFLIVLGTSLASYALPLLFFAGGMSTFPFRILNENPSIQLVGNAVNVVLVCFIFHRLLNVFYRVSWKQSLLLLLTSSAIIVAVVFAVVSTL
ncbi:MAG TPA: hypothetical protein VJI74_03105 [Candidatus Paceibacterota bacterium]